MAKAKNTRELADVVEASRNAIRDAVRTVNDAMNSETIENFRQSMKAAGCPGRTADDYAAGLGSAYRRMNDDFASISAELGSMGYCIEMGVHKARAAGAGGSLSLTHD